MQSPYGISKFYSLAIAMFFLGAALIGYVFVKRSPQVAQKTLASAHTPTNDEAPVMITTPAAAPATQMGSLSNLPKERAHFEIPRAPANQQEPTESTSTDAPIAASIKAEQAAISSEPSPRSSPVNQRETKPGIGLVRDFWIWAGTGMNFMNYSQSVPNLSDVNFGGISSSSVAFRSGFFFDEHFGLELTYKNTPSKASSSESILVRNESFKWRTLTVELIWRPSNDEDQKKSEWLWLLGVSQHQMPFIFPLAVNEITVDQNNLTAASIGFEYRKFTKKKIRFETQLRYQHPLTSSTSRVSNMKINPQLSLDGSIGAAYELRPHVFIGTYWHGQYHDYKFNYNTSNGSAISGSQSLFHSTFDLRLGVEF